MTQETDGKKYKLGLALSGGGAKGFAHIGVFKLMEECAVLYSKDFSCPYIVHFERLSGGQ